MPEKTPREQQHRGQEQETPAHRKEDGAEESRRDPGQAPARRQETRRSTRTDPGTPTKPARKSTERQA